MHSVLYKYLTHGFLTDIYERGVCDAENLCAVIYALETASVHVGPAGIRMANGADHSDGAGLQFSIIVAHALLYTASFIHSTEV